ncbi:hypothetical protein [Aeromonas hydrophila]|jgi:hypothetical protein|uniref:hypothetical protein n=1 Tax=Aeromonas hydrophila TaxID=644 RepID=UPI000332AE22|nr:hypothetical protein [Aeromonas hydrophila]AGM42752.1 hypothetical protein AHML_04840 [Aeromonas hydrophila ML09-119]AHX31471.1 hypothetical protein V428_05060 [Aeromonas hydrophila subsp. hydrophila AL09-71]AHX68266.1 hypothetical protein V429_05060 [Aeromonas hydrophila pc104A]AJE37695.1 hypothetical protein V469_18295 [Aeromonas hydrophila J-1]AKJ35983.1 hypothetical protein U876_18915 [Aeromonas hydrophila NJ-35]
MSLIQQVAEWVHARPGGAISAEVAAEFSLTVSKASIAMGQILKETRFTARAEHFCLVGDNGKGRHTRRLYVDAVKPPQWRKTPVIGTCGDLVVRFDSVTDAETKGGFVRVGITRCLAGQQEKHGGYRWQIDTTKGAGKCTATTTP